MNKIYVFFIILIPVLLFGELIEVKQDGTGDFTSIQSAIDASSDGDSVLVYSGVYYENISFMGKAITVGSLRMTSGDSTYVSQTIIDGHNSGSVIRFENREYLDSVLDGFTLQHGSGTLFYNSYYGGGIFIVYAQPTIKHCVIQNNKCEKGAGISIATQIDYGYSNPRLSGCTIRYNTGLFFGGGISIIQNSTITLDPVDLNSIYMNYSGNGSEIAKGYDSAERPLNIIVDTFTVQYPSRFHIDLARSFYEVNFSCQNWIVEPVSADLYVSPAGDDNNTGLTEDNPLKSIKKALVMIEADSLNPHIIHLGPGTYSWEQNEESFPVNLKSYVSILGAGPDATLLDIHGSGRFLYKPWMYEKNITLGQFKINNNLSKYSTMETSQTNGLVLRDIEISNNVFVDGCWSMLINTSARFDESLVINNSSLTLDRIVMKNNSNSVLFHILGIHNVIIQNCVFQNNKPNFQISIPVYESGDVCGDIYHPGEYKAVISNCLIADNQAHSNDWSNFSAGLTFRDVDAKIINSTFANNQSMNPLGGAVRIYSEQNTNVELINSVLYGNNPYEIKVGMDAYPDGVNHLTFKNSLIQDGMNGIHTSGINMVEDLGNNLSINPLFAGINHTYPYSLTGGSPCLNTGTMEISGYSIPENDLAGNPRVYNEMIDMGAYEYQNVHIIDHTELNKPETLSLYPNPFNSSTTIRFNLSKNVRVLVAIFNIKGQKVKTLTDKKFTKGSSQIFWNGTDEQNQPVASGVYFVRLVTDNETVSRKLMLVK